MVENAGSIDHPEIPDDSGHVRLNEKGSFFSTRDQARVVLAEFEQAGMFPLTTVDFAGVSHVSNAFSSELLFTIARYCETHDCATPVLRNLSPDVEEEVRWVLKRHRDKLDFMIVN